MIKEKIKKQILNEVFKCLDKNNIFIVLFGSTALGEDTPYSDIDIGVFSSFPIDDETFLKLKENLNLYVDTARIIDLVDFSKANEDFLEFALKGAIIWHIGKDFIKNLTKQKEHFIN